MAAKKVGVLIREARTEAGLTQAQLAKKIPGLSATDISRAERGETELTQAQLKSIAKVTGVTQSSLLNAPKGGVSSPSSGSSSSSASMKVSAAEKKLVQLYRKADASTKKAAVSLLETSAGADSGVLDSLLGGALELLTGKK